MAKIDFRCFLPRPDHAVGAVALPAMTLDVSPAQAGGAAPPGRRRVAAARR
ncbi:hypothetical protein SAMN05880590_108217 [Rhizobium sp. RU35A]|uniref:hypothetical protein n=1 Tax=Rhizobium sp. RU35A TaxID=1907414 RepID=UPI0009545265|nr:hypothetical protein [Rhizobium sp. RU35A]SIQ90134.1 hypothetical protein SAMN05880590_108217 [Rhizobium sp. RU35A]